jgi:hypothetical protein
MLGAIALVLFECAVVTASPGGEGFGNLRKSGVRAPTRCRLRAPHLWACFCVVATKYWLDLFAHLDNNDLATPE